MSEKSKQNFWDKAAFVCIMLGALPFMLFFGALIGAIVLDSLHFAFATDDPTALPMR